MCTVQNLNITADQQNPCQGLYDKKLLLNFKKLFYEKKVRKLKVEKI